ncbi:MAG: zinc-binding dehydrogenase [Chloroflexi bacterium]|nr:zinc-binding dehydrogenase [Chloroflexota bacterium]MDA1229120.1 zinc-binding dehydrogenase [Chloroflexota bacterium]
MKALVYHGNRDLRLESVPDPRVGNDEVKIHVDYCGICATDVEEYLYGPVFISGDKPNPLTGKKIPIISGHEITGSIQDVGRDVHTLAVGDRVIINGVLTCKTCFWCLRGETTQCPSMAAVGFNIDGGLADFISWPASHVIRLPYNVSSEQAALAEPSAVALHAVRRSRLQLGETTAILGVGTVGLLAMQAAKAIGGKVFAVDKRKMSLDLAKSLGADAVINSDETNAGQALLDLTRGVGPDVVIDAAGGKETPGLAIKWARRGGRVVLVAIYTHKPEFNFNDVVSTEVEVLGSMAYQQRDVEEVVRMLANDTLKTLPLISDRIHLDEVIDKGFARMLAPNKDVFRILVSPAD